MQTADYSIGVLPWVFLGVGLAIGLVAVWRLKSTSQTNADRELLHADLEAQRDEILARLSGDTAEELTTSDRQHLEIRAARTLRELDALGSVGSVSLQAQQGPARQSGPAQRGFWARHPALGGAMLGGGIVALVLALVALAMQDAAPAEEQTPSTPPMSAAAPASASQPPLPPFVQQQVDALRTRLEANPQDIAVRRELALMLLSADHPFDAFQEANLILSQEPDDPQALYITGFVRYLMGQPQDAIAQFDRAIANAPGYSQAWLVKGLILLQVGEREQAISTWEAGLDAAGGSESRLEHLISEARTDKSVEEILANPPR